MQCQVCLQYVALTKCSSPEYLAPWIRNARMRSSSGFQAHKYFTVQEHKRFVQVLAAYPFRANPTSIRSKPKQRLDTRVFVVCWVRGYVTSRRFTVLLAFTGL